MSRNTLRRIVSCGLGLFLLAAAALKVYGRAADPVTPVGIFSEAWFQAGVIVFEFFLGGWLLSGKHPLGSWVVASAAFTAFAVTSFFLGAEGRSSCGCFGQLAVSPWTALSIDA